MKNVYAIFLIALSMTTLTAKAQSDELIYPCGLSGTVDQRIRECASPFEPRQEGFALVTRTQEYKEVYLELATNLLWGDELPARMNHYDAMKACNSELAEVGRISDLEWRLPTKEEFEIAERNGIRSYLPHMQFWLWSSTTQFIYPELTMAWVYAGDHARVYQYGRDSRGIVGVRCVAKRE